MSTERLHISPAGAVTAIAAAGFIGLLVHAFVASNTVRSTPVQPVALMAPPPPVAPRPEMNEPKEKEEERQSSKSLDTGDWTPGGPQTGAGASGPAQSDNTLGLDEAGGSGTDAFGLAGKPGATELLLTGGGGGGGDPNGRFLQFASQLQDHLATQLNQLPELKQACYRVHIQVRVSATGVIEDVKIRKSTGDRALDAAIGDALIELAPMATAPPSDMPWPISLEVISRRAACASGGSINP